jgi:hypothetical protein
VSLYLVSMSLSLIRPQDGGDNDEVATTSSGGRHDERGWSSRLMWRTGGAGEMYTYLPPSFSANQALCHVPPYSTSNPTYGTSVGRGSFFFQRGEWTTVTQRMRLNHAGQENGELELFVNGQSRINVSGLVLRSSEAGPHPWCADTNVLWRCVFIAISYLIQLNTPFYMCRSHS